jgi:hypothetical protein
MDNTSVLVWLTVLGESLWWGKFACATSENRRVFSPVAFVMYESGTYLWRTASYCTHHPSYLPTTPPNFWVPGDELKKRAVNDATAALTIYERYSFFKAYIFPL